MIKAAAVGLAAGALACGGARATEFDGQLILRVTSPATGSAFAFRQGDGCVVLTAWHVIAGNPSKVVFTDGAGGRFEGAAQNDAKPERGDLDVAVVKLTGGRLDRCPEAPSPERARTALAQPVGQVVVLEPTGVPKHIAVGFSSEDPRGRDVALSPLSAADAAYQGVSGGLVLFDRSPVAVAVGAPDGRIHAVPLWAIAAAAPRTFAGATAAATKTVEKYSLLALPPNVRAVVVEARRIREIAEDRAERAREVGRNARQAASYAEAGLAGYATFDAEGGENRYEGHVERYELNGNARTRAAGPGVSTKISGEYLGEYDEGNFAGFGGSLNGVGRHVFGKGEHNRGLVTYEGEFKDGTMMGYNVITSSSGKTYQKYNANESGTLLSNNLPAVYEEPSGARIEGTKVKGDWEGLGVEWYSDGSLYRCGRWHEGVYAGPVDGCPRR